MGERSTHTHIYTRYKRVRETEAESKRATHHLYSDRPIQDDARENKPLQYYNDGKKWIFSLHKFKSPYLDWALEKKAFVWLFAS